MHEHEQEHPKQKRKKQIESGKTSFKILSDFIINALSLFMYDTRAGLDHLIFFFPLLFLVIES